MPTFPGLDTPTFPDGLEILALPPPDGLETLTLPPPDGLELETLLPPPPDEWPPPPRCALAEKAISRHKSVPEAVKSKLL